MDEKKNQRQWPTLGQFVAGNDDAPRTTIVGGQPFKGPPMRPVQIPIGLEKVLYAAAVNPEFCAALLRDRDQAVIAQGMQLRQGELAMLRLAPEAQLRSVIAGLDVTQPSLRKKKFLRGVAAAAVTLAAGGAVNGCVLLNTTVGSTDGGLVPADARLVVDAGSRDGGQLPTDATVDVPVATDAGSRDGGQPPVDATVDVAVVADVGSRTDAPALDDATSAADAGSRD